MVDVSHEYRMRYEHNPTVDVIQAKKPMKSTSAAAGAGLKLALNWKLNVIVGGVWIWLMYLLSIYVDDQEAHLLWGFTTLYGSERAVVDLPGSVGVNLFSRTPHPPPLLDRRCTRVTGYQGGEMTRQDTRKSSNPILSGS